MEWVAVGECRGGSTDGVSPPNVGVALQNASKALACLPESRSHAAKTSVQHHLHLRGRSRPSAMMVQVPSSYHDRFSNRPGPLHRLYRAQQCDERPSRGITSTTAVRQKVREHEQGTKDAFDQTILYAKLGPMFSRRCVVMRYCGLRVGVRPTDWILDTFGLCCCRCLSVLEVQNTMNI